jgi:hypothetical protein
MPLFEYALVALMGAAAHPSATITTLGVESISQPNGGALFADPQAPGKDKKVSRKITQRGHRKHRKHRRAGLAPDAITIKQKSK